MAFYCMGWSVNSAWPFIYPVLIELPLLFVLFFVLAITLILSLGRCKDRLWTFAMMLGFIALISSTRILFPTPDVIRVHGLRDHVMREYTLDELRAFAREVHQGIDLRNEFPEKSINHGDTSRLTPSEKLIYSQLREKYSFTHWMDHGRKDDGASIFSPADGVVNFDWGGALPGHWGCSIALNGMRNEAYSDSHAKALRVSDDIYFYSGD